MNANWIKTNPFIKALKRFGFHRGTTLAAASSFYFLLTVVPLTLLLVRLLGFIFGDLTGALDQVFLLAKSFFPGLTGDFIEAIKELVKTALFGPAKLTLINFIFLLVGSLSFVNSLWTGVYLMSQDRTFLSWRNYIRGIALLGFSSIFVTVLFLIPSLFVSIVNFIQTSQVVVYLFEVLPLPRELLLDMAILNVDKGFLLKSDFIALTLFVIYFTFAIRQLFKARLLWKDALISATVFSFGLFIMKRLFWLYLETSKQSLLSSYGKTYSLVLGVFWVYFSMSLFFVIISFATELLERRRALDVVVSGGYYDGLKGGSLEGEQN